MKIIPLNAPLGAEVHGFDFAAPLDSDLQRELRDAVDEYLVLLFRNGDNIPTNQQVEDFCSAWGPLRPTLADRSRLPGHPGINRVSNRDDEGVQGTGGTGLVTWHSDLTFNPPLIEFLYLDALHITSTGGDTKWTNLCAAYDALDPALRHRIDDVGVRYRLRDGLDFSGYFKASNINLADSTEISLVQRNARTGRRSVWPNTGPDFAQEVVGYSPADGARLLAELYAHCAEDRFVYRHRWQVGDACVWINTQTMHEREAFPADELRVMRHVNILGVADPRQAAAA